MFQPSTRRSFLQSAAGGGMLGLSGLLDFQHLMADERAAARPWALRYDDEMEPLVQWLEETPLETCVPELAAKLRRGLSHGQFLAALFLAGLRNGGDFSYYHCLYMLHSAHALSRNAPLDERLLSMFGALGIFKDWQQKRYAGNEHFGWRKEPRQLPATDKAVPQFRAAINAGDQDAAEAAMIVLSRSRAQSQLLDVLAPFTLGDGVHGWICLSNLFRIFPVIGWRHTEPALRMMARNYAFDGHWSLVWLAPRWEAARSKFGTLPRTWSDTRSDPGATVEFLAALRDGDAESILQLAYQQLATGKLHAGSIWDAIHLAAAERFLVDRGDGNALHMNTGMNALHYAFRTCLDDGVRQMILLRAIVWTAEPFGVARDVSESASILQLSAADIPALPQIAAEEILHSSAGEGNAVHKAFAFAKQHPTSTAVWQAYRRTVIAKGTDAHPYKYLAAVWEDAELVSSAWRPHVMATSVAGNTGEHPPDAPVILQAGEALRGT